MLTLTQYHENTPRPVQDFPFYLYPLSVEKSGPHVPMHWHEEIEVILPSLDGTLYADGTEYPFNKGDILFLNPGQLHATSVSESGSVIHMVFHLKLFFLHQDTPFFSSIGRKLLEGDLHFPTHISAKTEVAQKLSPLLYQMFSTAKCQDDGFTLFLTSDFYRLLALLQIHGLLKHHQHQTDSTGLTYTRSAINYMKQHTEWPLNVSSIASHLGISEGYFSRIFKQYTHMSPIAYSIERRLETAYTLLQHGSSVTEAAQSIGIDNISYFIRIYKKKYGLTPNKTRISL